MRYVGAFSADMGDLLREQERERLILFAENFFEAIEKNAPTARNFKPVVYREFHYVPGRVEKKVDVGAKKVVVVTDSEDNKANLAVMVERFRKSFSKEVEVINLHDIDIKGGCLGCLLCAFDNICAYQDKDEYIDFYNTKLKTADVLVFAGTIRDRYLSSRWKLFFDRSFFNTHTPTLIGKQIGYIISGPLSQMPNLRQIFEAHAEWQHANLVDFITDEYEDSAEIDVLLQSLAERSIRFADKNYIRPATFLGIGGMKIFRDDIWGRLRFVFQADHRFYKKHGIYDFPQKDTEARKTNKMMFDLTKDPKIKEEIHRVLKSQPARSLQQIIDSN